MAAFLAKNLPLNVLILNAGVFLPPHSKTQQGFEARRRSTRLPLCWQYVLPSCPAAVLTCPVQGAGNMPDMERVCYAALRHAGTILLFD